MICKRNIYVLDNDLLCNRALENGLTSTKKIEKMPYYKFYIKDTSIYI